MPGIVIQSTETFRSLAPRFVSDVDKKVNAEQRRAEWLQLKRGKFGASSAGSWWTPSTMLEANNATTRKNIANKAAELDGAYADEISARALSWGNDEEGPGMEEFCQASGLTVTHYGDDQEWIEWSECDQIGATPDGIVTDKPDLQFVLDMYRPKSGEDNMKCLTWQGPIPVEQKNPQTPAEHARMVAHIKTGADLRKAEFKYWCQVQQQIMVLNAPFGIFFTRDKRRESEAAKLVWWIVPRDQDFIEAHGKRLLRAVQERDEMFAAQSGVDRVDFRKVFK